MTGLALSSVRSRLGSLAACALSVFLGTVLMAGFTSQLETSFAEGVSDGDAETLIVMATVVGSWGVVIVLFSVASTLTVAVRQRAAEIALLRAVGATRRQVRSLVRRETAVVAVASSAVGLVPGWLLGRWILDRLIAVSMVSPGVEHRFGVATAVTLVVVVTSVALGAATLAARRVLAAADGEVERTRLGRGRIVLGVLLLLAAANSAVLTLNLGASSDDPFRAMQLSGNASIVASIAVALLSPPVVRTLSRLVPERSVAGHLASSHLCRRAVSMSAALAPVVVFVSVATGTLYLMAVHADSEAAGVQGAEEVVFLNYVVVGMIAAFAAIMVVNTIVATTLDRRDELARHRLSGATRGELVRSVAIEGTMLAVLGVLLGGAASLATIVPFTVVETDGWLPDDGPWFFAWVAGAALLVTLASSVLAARRALAGEPVSVTAGA